MTKNNIQPGIYVAESSGRDKPLKGLIVRSKLERYVIHKIEKLRSIEKLRPVEIFDAEYWGELKVRHWIKKHKATMVM